MPDQPFDEYLRIMQAACKAIAEAKIASDRGDAAEYRRLLDKSVRLGKKAISIMKDGEEKPT